MQVKQPSVPDRTKFYYLMVLRDLVELGNPVLLDALIKRYFKRLAGIAEHRKDEKTMDRGRDCLI